MGLSRRELLVLSLGVAASGCTSGPGEPSPVITAGATRATPPPASPTPPPPALPPVAAYRPSPSESLPQLKRVAAGFLESLGTVGPGRTGQDAMAQAIAGGGAPTLSAGPLAAVAAALFEEDVQTAEVLYPQLAGLGPPGPGASKAAVMVVLRQRLLSRSGAVGTRVRTCDLRLSVVAGTWLVTELASVGGEPVDRPAGLAAPAQRLLDDARFDLPDSARWDIHAGRVAPELIDLLLRTPPQTTVAVTVLSSGHPVNVFGTDRRSDHDAGLAVDLWKVGDRLVVEQQADRAGPALALQAAVHRDAGLSQVGSPPGTDLDGPARRSFDDLVHEDHLHLAARGASRSR